MKLQRMNTFRMVAACLIMITPIIMLWVTWTDTSQEPIKVEIVECIAEYSKEEALDIYRIVHQETLVDAYERGYAAAQTEIPVPIITEQEFADLAEKCKRI